MIRIRGNVPLIRRFAPPSPARGTESSACLAGNVAPPNYPPPLRYSPLHTATLASRGHSFRAGAGSSTIWQLTLGATKSLFQTNASQSVNWITSTRFVSYVQAYQPIAPGFGTNGTPAPHFEAVQRGSDIFRNANSTAGGDDARHIRITLQGILPRPAFPKCASSFCSRANIPNFFCRTTRPPTRMGSIRNTKPN
ncbi:hypothetical protein ACVIIW_000082 [Bradyrhizobium sp. USDA 4449]